jgi:hypothetical protein
MDGMGDTDQEVSGVGSSDPGGPSGNDLESEEVEAWNKQVTRWRMEAKEMHPSSEGHKGLVYDQLHSLTYDADWWRSYMH